MSEFFLGLPGNEQPIPTPESFTIEPQQITREGRTASGRLVKDVIAVKRQFTLSYGGMTPEQAAVFVTEFNRNQFLSFTFPDQGQTQAATVWFGTLPRELRWQLLSHWNGVSITLDEQ